jgi:DNA-binding MarR family transcriptional regulator
MTTKTPQPRLKRPVRQTRAARVPAAPAEPVFYDPDNYQPNDSIGYMMRRIVNMVTAEIDHELEPSDLTSAQWVPLLKLHMGLGSTVAELARGCQQDAGSMTRLLDRLEAKGLVRRVRSGEDRRVVNIELTDEGRAAARRIPAVLCGVQNAYMRGFSVQEWQTLKGLLRRVLDNALTIQAEREGQQ